MGYIHLYRGVNYTKGEVYHGISRNPYSRQNGSHCLGGTKVLRHWNCSSDKIVWLNLSLDRRFRKITRYRTLSRASLISHSLERNYTHPSLFKNILTRGL